MRMMAVTAAALLGTTALAFAGDQSEPNQECGVSTYEMVECLSAKTAYWDKKMNGVYQGALKDAQPKQREQLRKAQRLWVQYRDANCLYFDLGEGTIARIEAADCMYRMTKTRAEELGGNDAPNADKPAK